MNRILTAAMLTASAFVLCTVLTLSASMAEDTTTKKDNSPEICEGLYALCTSAPCVPDPENKDSKAICSCEVNKGINFGYSSCDSREKKTDDYGVTNLISTYSFAQGPSKPVLSCPKGKPWTDCLDKSCTVNPLNPLNAYCKCDIIRDEAFVTYGGDCNMLTCDNGYWSGATVEAYIEASTLLSEKMGIKDFPVVYCPGMKPKAD